MELTDKLSKTVVKDIDSLGIIMEKLEEIRAFQSIIDISLNPIEDMYLLLENFLPGGITDKDEMDARSYLRSNWSNLVDMSEKIGKNLSV
jgi:dynein heavy chain